MVDKKEEIHQVVKNLNEVTFIISPDWKIVYYVSPFYEMIWGKSCNSLYENPFSWIDSLHPEDKSKVFSYIRSKVVGNYKEISFPDYRVVREDGSFSWIEARGVPIYDDEGEIYRIAGICVDITDRKKAEEEKLELIDSLEKALKEIETLRGIIPICCECKSIRNDKGAWELIESYLSSHSDLKFSHGICPDCAEKIYGLEP